MPVSSTDSFESLAARSRNLHGHRYVLPVAGWMLESQSRVTGATEVMAGLGGRADRTRVIEALAKLAEFGAVVELPRESRKTAPRFFERIDSPYWHLVQAYLVEPVETIAPGADPGRPRGVEGSQIP
jgi:hypothetical protein